MNSFDKKSFLILISINMLRVSTQLPKSNSTLGSSLDISRVYAFGESYTDFGNLYRLTNHTKPDPRYYYEGRTSNGPTWIEHFMTRLETKPKVISFAYGGATSDNERYPASVPSAKEQIEKEFHIYHKNNLKDYEENQDRSLFVFAFGGNEVGYPNSDPKAVIESYVEALRTLVSTYAIPKIAVMTENGSKFIPLALNMPRIQQNEYNYKNQEYNSYWPNYMKKLRLEFPDTKFIDFAYLQFHTKMIQNPNPRTGQPWNQITPCLAPKLNSTTEFDICEDDQNLIFWDDIHITTQVHELYFNYIINKIIEKS